jgi:hypothetical protein
LFFLVQGVATNNASWHGVLIAINFLFASFSVSAPGRELIFSVPKDMHKASCFGQCVG